MVTQIPVKTQMATEHPNMRFWFRRYIEKENWKCDKSLNGAHHFLEIGIEVVKLANGDDNIAKRIWRCKWCLKEKKTKEVILYSYNDPRS